MTCILAAFWINQPKRLILWYYKVPLGENWDYITKNITDFDNRVIMIYREPPHEFYGVPLSKREHKADKMRMEALIILGGIYLDLDAVTLKSFNPLRNYSFTIGRETGSGLCNGIMVSEANAPFLLMWHIAYVTFYANQWAQHSVILPNTLEQYWRAYAHVEEDTMDRPNWTGGELPWIYGQHRVWNWKKNYCVHLWYRFHGQQYNFESIKKVDSMLGDMFRFVLYGNATKS